MTIPEASQLVIQAGAMEHKNETGGEVYVLDMGSPIKILDLARRMIDLAGLRVKDVASPFGDIEIKISGLRPGEKLFEELLIGDNVSATTHPLISCAEESYPNRLELEQGLLALSAAIDQQDSRAARVHLLRLVPSFTPTSKNVDHLLDDNSPRQPRGIFATDKSAAKPISRSNRLPGIQFEHGKIQ
jgi:FlaA1/EpsC-like NDP-sugar epimerase